jgi:endoglucanase
MRRWRHHLGRCVVVTAALATVVAGSSGAVARSADSARPTVTGGPAAVVRVDSVGFLTHDTKRGYLMTDHAVSGETFQVVDSHGAVAAAGTVQRASRGRWSAAYPDVYGFSFSTLTAAGRYHLRVSGPVSATSPPFRIERSRTLYGRMVRQGVSFFQVQRDGADQVPGPLHRKPSHLSDAHAAVYRRLRFRHPETDDTISGRHLTRVTPHATVDVEGGWFDAGDYLKFTHTTAYADVLLSASQRALGAHAPRALVREARHGELWLRRMWRQRSRTLYLQVGIGTGNRAGSFFGDHDLWRLPETDSHDTRHRDRYATIDRPVFRATAPGHPISPNLVGRVAAAFALAAQNDARAHRRRAGSELRAATSLYAMAATRHPPRPLVTTAPVEYYPETTWHDDMALGASEIALAQLDLHRGATTYLRAAARWIKDYLRSDTGDTQPVRHQRPSRDRPAPGDATRRRPRPARRHSTGLVVRPAGTDPDRAAAILE